MVNRCFMKLFETSAKNIVESCQEKNWFYFANYSIGQEKEKFEEKYMNTYDRVCTYNI